MKDLKRIMSPKLVGLLLLLLFLPILLFGSQTVQELFIRATGTPANITIDTAQEGTPINHFWSAFSQGGEESTDMIGPVVADMKNLLPRAIRIDHLYDHFNVVSRNDSGQLTYDFTKLDQLVRSILATGAKPFFSLSYMPSVLTESGNVTDKPRDWNEWAAVVQTTIEHYSGRSGFNLTDVSYEVWNEPDLFGNWKAYGDKNYLTLYSYAAAGASRARNTNYFQLGGPATTSLLKNWIEALVKLAQNSHVRLDFLSWHQYSLNPTSYSESANQLTDWLSAYPEYTGIPRLITEWGFNPEIDKRYDSAFAASHTVASIRQALTKNYQDLFAFEPVDGPDPANQTYWGRWGLITHPNHDKIRKPRYQAFNLLKNINGNLLPVSGEGTWVTGFATKIGPLIKLMLVNFDQYQNHAEQPPVTFTNLPNGEYKLTTTRLGSAPTTQIITVNDNTYHVDVIMNVNSVVLFELLPNVP